MTFTVSKETLVKMLKGNPKADAWAAALINILPKYEINTDRRIAGFIAQCAHESLNFTVLEENLNYSATNLEKVFSKYFSKAGRKASEYAKKPEKIANIVYASRMGNGDTASGDGYKFRGRGIIQLTGRDNYTNFGKSIGKSPDEVISYLSTMEGALESACWYWKSRNINRACDNNDIVEMTRLVNGGNIGLADRREKYQENLKLIAADKTAPVSATIILKRGSRGDLVKKLQSALGITADGIFGVVTEATLKSWQKLNGINPTGIADANTLMELL